MMSKSGHTSSGIRPSRLCQVDGIYLQDEAKAHRKKVIKYLDGQFGPRMFAFDTLNGPQGLKT